MSDLRTRLVQALLDAIGDGDPLLVIGIGQTELRVGWDMDFPAGEQPGKADRGKIKKRRIADLEARVDQRERASRNLLASLECTDAHLRALDERLTALEDWFPRPSWTTPSFDNGTADA